MSKLSTSAKEGSVAKIFIGRKWAYSRRSQAASP